MNSVEWNPKYNLLAYAGDDKNKYQADEGIHSFLLWCYFIGHTVVDIYIHTNGGRKDPKKKWETRKINHSVCLLQVFSASLGLRTRRI